MILSRRKLFTGIAALIAAPTIVRVASIMPVRSLPLDSPGIVVGYDFTIDQFSKLYIEPAMRKLEAQLKADADVMAREMWSTPSGRGGLDFLLS